MKLDSSVKILVTGANGQLGYQLVKALDGKVDLLALDRSSLDITNPELVDLFVKNFCPDIIINTAAYTAVDKAEEEQEKADAVNHLGPKYLACAASEINAALIHISTDYVFSGNSAVPYCEEDNTAPQNIYGKTKKDGELAVLANCKRTVILRTSWVFCEHGNNFVKTMLRLAKNEAELSIVADQVGGPTYAGDIANAIIDVCLSIIGNTTAKWGIFHYGGKPYVSWYEFARKIFCYADKYDKLKSIPKVRPVSAIAYPTAAKRPRYSKLDCRKIKKEFGSIESDWELALDKIIRN